MSVNIVKPPAKTLDQYYTRQRHQRYSTSSFNGTSSRYAPVVAQTLDYLPFDLLPMLCKSLIFQYMSIFDRGRSRLVCKEWNELISTSSLWSVIDLSLFELCHVKSIHACDKVCYQNYIRRVRSFIAYICWVRPSVRYLRFSFDIGDSDDGWMLLVEQLMASIQVGVLKRANINWKETLVKPFWVDNSGSTNNYKQLIVKHRNRQRMFARFFEEFTSVASNLTSLIIPLYWSQQCIESLGRMKSLKTLLIQKYFVFQMIQQNLLDDLFVQLPQLETLILQTWMPCGHGLHLYTISSPILKHLNISQGRGFFLKTLHLPELTLFKVLRHPWNGPLVSVDSMNIPCLYDVLRTGAPKLQQINEFTLRTDWSHGLYDELEAVMKFVCSCRKHKNSWNM